MKPISISTRMPSVIVEYDHRGGRKQKKFDDVYEARRFFVLKNKAGKNPKVLRSEK